MLIQALFGHLVFSVCHISSSPRVRRTLINTVFQRNGSPEILSKFVKVFSEFAGTVVDRPDVYARRAFDAGRADSKK